MIVLDPENFATTIRQGLAKHPALYSVQYAVTYRCNESCVHCYAQGAEQDAPPELTPEEVRDIFAQFAEAGCLHCTVTGGEALLRPDFEALWLAIADQGIRRLLFTNATLATERRCAFLRETPPDWIEVSLYGADAATHDAITRQPGSFEATFEGIRRMQRAGLRVRLKSIVMRPNAHQIGAIKALAQQAGDGSFRLDGQLLETFRGRADIDALRVPPAELVQIEWTHGDRTNETWQKIQERPPREPRTSLYRCGAASHSVYLGPWGDLHPCLTAEHRSCSLRELSVRQAWERLRNELSCQPWPDNHPCQSCDNAVFCQNCAPVAQLETGSETGVSPYRCELAQQRRMLYKKQLSRVGDANPAAVDA